MRLIGGKDYYDGAGGFVDTDPTRVYVRSNFRTAEPVTDNRLPEISKQIFDARLRYPSRNRALERPDIAPLYVIFCGTLHQGAYRFDSNWNAESGHMDRKYHCFWTLEDLMAEMERQEADFEKDRAYYHYDWYKNYIHEARVEEFFEPRTLTGADLDFLIENQITQSIGFGIKERHHNERTQWYDNTDGLKDVGFAKRVDVWQANQQIDMFVGSILAREEDRMVKLSDKEMIAKHGFDEVSFRNTHHKGKPRGRD